MHPLAGLNVFISYPRGGHAHTWAERVEAALRASRAQPCRDEGAIQEGDTDWLQRLKEGLLKSDMLVCILGHGSDVCRWQQRELIRADKLHIPVVAFRVDAVDVPFEIAQCQPVELIPLPPVRALWRASISPVRRAGLWGGRNQPTPPRTTISLQAT